MREEISAAVLFLTRLIGKNENISATQVEQFSGRLCTLLQERFQNHWFPDRPAKGQGYRCIRVNELDRIDPILKRAAQDCGLKYEDLQLPIELTLWVDPDEVCCRFGEHKGSYCILASFKEGSKENNVNKINIEDFKPKLNGKHRHSELAMTLDGVDGSLKMYNNRTAFHQQPQPQYMEIPNSHHNQHHLPTIALYRSSPPQCYFIPLRSNSASPPNIGSSPPLSSASFYNSGCHYSPIASSHPARINYAIAPVALHISNTSPSRSSDRYHMANRSLIKT